MGPPIGTNVSLSGGISVFFMTRYIAAKYITLKNADQIFLDVPKYSLRFSAFISIIVPKGLEFHC